MASGSGHACDHAHVHPVGRGRRLHAVTSLGVAPQSDASGQEIGDKCNFTFGPTDASGADLVANGHPYMVQQEWSNRIGGCSMS